MKWVTEGHEESAGPARLSSVLNISTGNLCQENAFSSNQENACLTSGGKHTLFPSRQRKGQWWLLALVALRAQSLTNVPRRGLAEESCFFVVENTVRESFGSAGAFSVVETQAIPAAELTNHSKKVRVDESRSIIHKERREWLFPTVASLHSWKGKSRAVPSLHRASVSSCGVWVVQMWLLRS